MDDVSRAQLLPGGLIGLFVDRWRATLRARDSINFIRIGGLGLNTNYELLFLWGEVLLALDLCLA